MPVSTSARYKRTVQNNARTWRLRLKIQPDSLPEPLELTEADITNGSFSFEESSVGSGMLDIGSTYSNSLQFSLENPNGRYNDLSFAYAQVNAWVGLLLDPEPDDDGEKWEDIPLGEFFVQEDGKKLWILSSRSIHSNSAAAALSQPCAGAFADAAHRTIAAAHNEKAPPYGGAFSLRGVLRRIKCTRDRLIGEDSGCGSASSRVQA